MNRLITSAAFAEALVEAGVMTRAEVNRTRRIVIDACEQSAVVMYVERFADEALLGVATTLQGIQITGVDREPAADAQ